MDPSLLPKGAGAGETVGNHKPANEPGIYKHEASGAVLTIMPDAQSTGQQDAAVRLGYVKVAEPPTRAELTKAQRTQAAADHKAGLDQPISTADFGGYNPDAPRFDMTSTTSDSTSNPVDNNANQKAVIAANEASAAAEARAAAAEAELAELKANQNAGSQESDADATDEGTTEDTDEGAGDDTTSTETKTEEEIK